MCSKLWSTQIVRNFKSEYANGTQIQNASTQTVRILRNLSNLQNLGASVVNKPVVCDSYLILFGFAEAIPHLISPEFRSIGFFNF